MAKKILKSLVVFGAALFTLMAHASAASACYVFFYQPKLPKALREE